MIFLSTLVLSVAITIALTLTLSSVAMRFSLVDIPNERKVHLHPVPRIGGTAMAVGAFIPVVYWNHDNRFVLSYLAGAGLLVLFGMVDDFRDLPPSIKFSGQIAAACIAVFAAGVKVKSLGMLAPDNYLLPDLIAVPLTVLAIVGVTNAINLADGLDGLAGGISLLIFCCIGFLAYLEGDGAIGLIALALAGAIFGFLRFNTHPASVFMGDAGSQLLGFSAITLSLELTQGHTPLSPVLPLLLVGFPVLDTLTVMVTRISRGVSPFAADRNHFHHNLLGLGLRHSESVLAIYVMQTILVMAAFLFRFYPDWYLLSGYLLFSALVVCLFSKATHEGWRVKRPDLLDALVIGSFRRLREDGTVINVTFRIFAYGLPLLLIVSCLLPVAAPPYIPAASLLLLAALAVSRLFGREWADSILRVALYFLIPFAVYLGDHASTARLDDPVTGLYNGLFGVFALFTIIITKFSRREGGFRSTPLDFLILIIVLVAPNIPELRFQDTHLGFVAAKIIILYFCFEVLLAELRGKYGRLTLATMAALLALATR